MTGKKCSFGVTLMLGALSVVFSGCAHDGNPIGPINAESGSGGGGDSDGPAASFQGLGSFAPGQSSFAYGLSGDGSVVVGRAYYADGTYDGFRWTVARGMVSLGSRTWDGYAASYDGSYITGLANHIVPDNAYGYRWNPVDGAVDIPLNHGGDISEDGSVIVCCAVRWKNGEVTGIGSLGACCTQVFGVSGDGQVVVGEGRLAAYAAPRAIRWTEATRIQELGLDGTATTASRDGSVIAGRRMIDPWESTAFRWTVAGGIEDMKTLGGKSATPRDMSADGSVIVGNAAINTSSVQRAFRWTIKKKMQDLRRELLDHGVQEVENWRALSTATGVSADGTVIVGYGINGNGVWEAFLAVLPIPR